MSCILFLCGLTLPPFTAKIGANRQRRYCRMTSIRKPYTTKTRTEILEYLKEHASSTVSVADIQNYLKEKRAETNTTTIYRFLDKLCREQMTKPFTNMPEKVPTVWSIFILNVPAADACFTLTAISWMNSVSIS